MNLNLGEILRATGAKVLKNEGVDDLNFAFSTDTRTIKKGEIYLPLKGENFDGEKFFDQALKMGAVGYFSTKNEVETSPMAKLVLEVEDTLIAYLELASFYKNKINPKTVAITGSSGKTTTKEMAYCVAKENFKTHKSELNFNNEIGLCKTLLSMPEDTEVLILEMGMRGLGEIELLSKYSTPDIAIIANVGTAHIGRLGSKENIARAKCEIVKHQKENGILIAHDDELVKREMENWEIQNEPPRQVFFSLDDVQILERKIGYTKFAYKNNEYELNIEGDYNVQNALSVIEMGLNLGMTPCGINDGLKKYSPIEKRWQVQEINAHGKVLKVINDSYNANPESVKASLETFLGLYNPPLVIVLGEMGELGNYEVGYHKEVGDFLIEKIGSKNNIDVITVGKLADEITKKLNEHGISSENFETNEQVSRYLLENTENGTTILLKASRSMKLEQIIEKMNDN